MLVIEDDDGIRGLLVELLTNAGYTVLYADRGRTGLSMAEDHQPSVILINHHLSDMSGLDVLEHLRRRPATCRTPVVLVSGRSHQLDGQPHGADEVVPMPFDIDVVLGHVENLAMLHAGSLV